MERTVYDHDWQENRGYEDIEAMNLRTRARGRYRSEPNKPNQRLDTRKDIL